MKRFVLTLLSVAVAVALVVVVAFGLAACGTEGGGGATPTATVTVTASPSPTATPTTTPASGMTMTVSLYFLRGEKLGVAHRVVPGSQAVAKAAMTALLGGPNGREKAAGLASAVPFGTQLKGIALKDGVARVDLSGAFAGGGGTLSMQARIAQVVYTLTQFPTVKAVVFLVNGEEVVGIGGEGVAVDGPQRRADWRGLLPAIFVESPAVGDVVKTSSLTVKGSASVFEATFQAELRLPEGVVVKKTVTATEGAPGRGTFLVSMKVPPFTGAGRLVVYEVSMQDGSPMNRVGIPLRFAVAD